MYNASFLHTGKLGQKCARRREGTTRTSDPNLPNGYSMPCYIMSSSKKLLGGFLGWNEGDEREKRLVEISLLMGGGE